MPAPVQPLAVFVDGKILYTTYDTVNRRHVIECDLCGLTVSGDQSGHATRLFEHRATSKCISRRNMYLGNSYVDPELALRLTGDPPEPAHLANRCPGAPFHWEHGSVWDAYAFHKHKNGRLGWVPAGFEADRVYIRSDDCVGQPAENGHPCKSCQVVINSKRFREVIGQAEGELDDRTPAEIRSYAQLLESFRKSAAERRRLRAQIRSLQRCLRVARRRLAEYQRLVMALSQRDIPRLRWVLTTAIKGGRSPKQILALVLRAADGIYRARGSTQRDRDLAFLVAALGGRKLLYALVHSHGLLSMSSVKRSHHYAQLLASVGVPTNEEIDQNILAFLDPAVWPLPTGVDGNEPVDAAELPGHCIMVDDVALEERAQYDQSRNHVVGFSRESVLATGVSTEASSATHIDHLATLLENKSLHLAKQATTVVIAPVAEPEHYSPAPLALAGSDKSEGADGLKEWLSRVLMCYNRHRNGAPTRGPVWSLASDGDATFRRVRHEICCSHCLPDDSPLRAKLQGLSGLNLHTSADGNTTATCDPKHIIKRFATLLRSQSGVRIGDSNVIPEDVLEALHDVGGHTRDFAVQLLDPADKQNVPKATRLMTELLKVHFLPVPRAVAASPARRQRLRRVTTLSRVLNLFTQPFIDVNMSLTEQLESLSAYSHAAAALFLHHRFKALTSALYADSQATVKNIFFMVARLQLLEKRHRLYLLHEGTDRLENVFADLRTLNHARNFDLLEAARKLTTAFHINSIFRRNPDLDQGHRRLDFSKVVGVDHLNPASWNGDVCVDGIDLQKVWDTGRERAVEILAPLLGAIDFASCTREGRDFLRPEGSWVGVSTKRRETTGTLQDALPDDDDRSERQEDRVTEYIEPATSAHRRASLDAQTPEVDALSREISDALAADCSGVDESCSDWNLDNLFDSDPTVLSPPAARAASPAPDGMSDDVPRASSPETSPGTAGDAPGGRSGGAAVSHQDPRVFIIDGHVFWKASYVKARLSKPGGKKVTLRPLRAYGVAVDSLFRKSRFSSMDDAVGTGNESVRRGDLVACLLRSGMFYNLAIVEITGFRQGSKPIQLSMTSDEFDAHCSSKGAVVIGQVLELRPISGSKWCWTGRYVPVSSAAKQTRAVQRPLSDYTVEIPAGLVYTVDPAIGTLESAQQDGTSADGDQHSNGTVPGAQTNEKGKSAATWMFTRTELQKLCDEAWNALEPATDDIFANASRLPSTDSSALLPYQSLDGTRMFIIKQLPSQLHPVNKVPDPGPETEDELNEPISLEAGDTPAIPPAPATLPSQPARAKKPANPKAKYECKLCTHSVALPQMRHHVALHLIRAARSTQDPQLSKVPQSALTPDACGWCGVTGTCTTTIQFRPKGAPIIKSTCSYHYASLGYTAARTSSDHGPSTNIPMHCPLCPILTSNTPRTIWKYAAADHFNKEHHATDTDPALSAIFFYHSHITREEERRMKIVQKATELHRKAHHIPDSDGIELPSHLEQSAQTVPSAAVHSPLPTRGSAGILPPKPSQAHRMHVPLLTPVQELADAQRPLSPSSQIDLLEQRLSQSSNVRARSATTESEKGDRPAEKKSKC